MYEGLIKSLRVCGRMTSIDDNCISYVNGCCEAFPDCAYALMDQAADAIETLNMELLNAKEFSDYADAVRELKPKWIPVTERLPMRGEKAICFGKNGYMIGTYGEFGWMFPCYFGNVTHWMPLPEPPKEET